MPTYKVTDPSTGKTLRLTGDSPPSETELNQIFVLLMLLKKILEANSQPILTLIRVWHEAHFHLVMISLDQLQGRLPPTHQ